MNFEINININLDALKACFILAVCASVKITDMEYALLMEFVKWCEDNHYTEWMGYLGKAEKVIGMFLEYKYGIKAE
jgi:hypothetical protein